MINLEISLYPDGCLKHFRASGHARAAAKGEDIVCSAVTALLRTCAKLLSSQPDIEIRGSAPHPGEMHLDLSRIPRERQDWIKGISDFLITGLRDLKSEYPDNILLKVD